MPVKGGYLLAAGGGAILLWSGFKGHNWSTTLRDLISGKGLPRTQDYPITTTPGAFTASNTGVGASASTGGTGSGIAEDAGRYPGNWQYVWGGAPGNGNRGDCSSFTNAVIGRDLGLAIPTYKAGAYHGQSHGPTTVVWLVWSGAFTIKRADAGPGDLAVWQTHMGIITDVGGQHMISALNAQLGCKSTTIAEAAPPGEKLFVRRLKAVTPGG